LRHNGQVSHAKQPASERTGKARIFASMTHIPHIARPISARRKRLAERQLACF
jgi:hypothetical protein